MKRLYIEILMIFSGLTVALAAYDFTGKSGGSYLLGTAVYCGLRVFQQLSFKK